MTKVIRYDAKRDSNEAEIIKALRAVGATVMMTDQADLIVGFRGVNYIFEAKSDGGYPSKNQVSLLFHWQGQIAIVRSVDEALRRIGAI